MFLAVLAATPKKNQSKHAALTHVVLRTGLLKWKRHGNRHCVELTICYRNELILKGMEK